ncbi:MAG: hypothetical protein GW905_13740 [Rhodobacterales bacterium]|nr:hypothetical protein [Rhodobacterales bacterium]
MSRNSFLDLTTDEAAEAFLDQDLYDLDFTRFQPLNWERPPKTAPAADTRGKTRHQ